MAVMSHKLFFAIALSGMLWARPGRSQPLRTRASGARKPRTDARPSPRKARAGARFSPKKKKKKKPNQRLAVLLVSTGGLAANLGDDLTEAFISALSVEGTYRITGKEEVKAAIGRGEKGIVECLQSPICLATVGTSLKVSRLAVGTLSAQTAPKGYRANLMLVDVGSGKILHRVKLEVKGGPQKLLAALLKAAPKLIHPPPPKIQLTLEIDVKDARVFLDGRRIKLGPNGSVPHLKPGRHTLTVKKKGYLTKRLKVELTPGDKRTVSVGMVKIVEPKVNVSVAPPWYKRWWVWTIVAGAVVTAVGVTVPLMVYEKKAPRGSMGTISFP